MDVMFNCSWVDEPKEGFINSPYSVQQINNKEIAWHGIEELIFHPKLVELVEQDNRHEITEELCKKLLNTDKYICTFDVSSLKIFWINIGDKFIIEEYDGWEDIKTVDNLTLTA